MRPINLVRGECHQCGEYKITAQDIINQPLGAEPTSLEKQTASNK